MQIESGGAFPGESTNGRAPKTLKQVRALAGFMDPAFFRSFAQDQIATGTAIELEQMFDEFQSCRRFVAELPVTDLGSAELEMMPISVARRIETHQVFRTAYSDRIYRFSWIDPTKLIALKAAQATSTEVAPTDEASLIGYALSTDWRVPAEVFWLPSHGQIYMMSSNPQLGEAQVSIDEKTGNVVISPNQQVNLIQVVEFKGRYYLRNGYHRVGAALRGRVPRLPALVVKAESSDEVEMKNLGVPSVSLKTSMSLARPPLVADFASPASMAIEMREKRYGFCVTLQTKPLHTPA